MKTRYFTFGQVHAHSVNGFTFDKDVIVKITAHDPRTVMHQNFGERWSHEYADCPDLDLFPRGIKELS